MATCFKRPDSAALRQRIEDMFSANVLGGAPIIPESNEWYVVNNDHAAQELFYSIAAQQWRERDPRYACCENLYDLAAQDGIYPRGATFARGYVKITGTAGAAIPDDLAMVFGSTNFRIDPASSPPAVLNASGEAVIMVQAITPGASGNDLSNGTTGTITSLAPGLDTEVSAFGQRFCGGQDAEECEAFRRRYIARKSYQPKADWAYFEAKALEWPCVTRVCRRACSCCYNGDIEAHVFFDGTFEHGLAPQDVVDDMAAWMFGNPRGYGFGQMPIGVFGDLFTARAVPMTVDILNLSCVTADQLAEIKRQIEGLLSTLCPGAKFCRKWIDAIVIGVEPKACDYVLNLIPEGDGLTVDCGGDVSADCDVLPVLGNFTVQT